MIPSWFLVAKKCFIDLFNDHNIGEYQKWPIKIQHKESILKDYYLFFLNETKQSEYVDFKKSQFYIGSLKDYNFIGNDIKVNDYENYLSTRKVLKEDNLWLKCKKTVLDLSKTNEDIFRLINVPNGGYYISERLKKAIEEKKMTGIVFKEIQNKNVEVIY